MKQKTKDIKNFLESIGLRHPKNHSEVKFLYKELGSFMAEHFPGTHSSRGHAFGTGRHPGFEATDDVSGSL